MTETTVIVPPFKEITSLKEGLLFIESLLSQGVRFTASNVYCDRYPAPRSRLVKALGCEARAGKEAARIAPGGKWTLEIVEDTGRFHADGPSLVYPFRAMAWYSKFAPYAYAMCLSEDGYHCLGIDYESINSIFCTVMGFVNLGLGMYDTTSYQRICQEDIDLFSRIFSESVRLHPPMLPFDEAYFPCTVFLAVRMPRLFAKQFCEERDGRLYGGGMYHKHALQVLEAINQPIPDEIKTIP